MSKEHQQERRSQVLAGLDHAITMAHRYIEHADSYGAITLVGFLPDLEARRAHFELATAHDAAPASIIINGVKHEVSSAAHLHVTYPFIVTLAGHDPGRMLSVTYRRGPISKPEGILSKGESVEVMSGMVFNVADTSNA